jgi:cytochrome c-type biogenesis protein CcmH/NrfG
MPDPGLLPVLLVLLVLAAAIVARPLLASGPDPGTAGEDSTADDELVALRRLSALDAIRDLEADRAAGSLSDAEHARLRADAEERAAAAIVASEAPVGTRPGANPPRPRHAARRPALALGAALLAALLVGVALPEPASLAADTVVDERLADQRASEEARQARIAELAQRIAADPQDREALSALADAYLAGSSRDDLAQAARALLLLIALEPDDEEAHVRLIAAYLRAGDYADARAATDALAELVPGSPDVAFYRGIIALRGDGDPQAAIAAFDRFLADAPDDPRAAMVRSLRAEAAAETPPSSP